MTTTERAGSLAAVREFKRFFRAMFRCAEPNWVELELTMAQFKTLMMVASTGGAHGRELATALGISPSTVSSIVDHLVERGLVYRQEDVIDRRITHNRPTEAGLALFERLTTARDDGLRGVLGRLGPDDLELVTRALHILGTAAEALAADLRPGAPPLAEE